MRRLALLVVASLFLACGGPDSRPDDLGGGPGAAPARALPPVVADRPAAAALDGVPVVEQTEGPWRWRVASRAALVGEDEETADGAGAAGDGTDALAGEEGAIGGAGEGLSGGAGAGSGGVDVGGLGRVDVGGGGFGLVGRGSGGGGSGAGRIVAVRGRATMAGRKAGVLRVVVGPGAGATGDGGETDGREGEPGDEVSADFLKPDDGAADDGLPDDGLADDAPPDGLADDGLADDGLADDGPLTASATDDNADLAGFLAFLAAWAERSGVADFYRPIDVRDRALVRVVDERGRPVPGATVHVTDESADRIVWAGTTYGDGALPLYPALAGLDAAAGGPLLVEAAFGQARGRARWDGRTEAIEVAVGERLDPPDAVPIDVLFLLDTTGSMGDEIDRIKETLLRVTAQVRALGRPVDLRYGALLYRDLDDLYLTAEHPFTADLAAFDEALRAIEADGGGDEPESLNQGLHEAVHRMRWREGAARVAFLIADAPPHMDYEGDTEYPESARDALAKGIRIHAVAASGLSEGGTVVFRQIAQLTRGQFIFIQYGTPAASAARHGVTGETTSNDLDTILFERIRDEVASWGRG